jgi:beta-lactam-binding protein with PASTA domain
MRTAILLLALMVKLTAGPVPMRGVPAMVKVPDVVGQPHARAQAAIERAGLEVDERRPSTSGDECRDKRGLVVRQTPNGGTLVAPHSKVQLAWCNEN